MFHLFNNVTHFGAFMNEDDYGHCLTCGHLYCTCTHKRDFLFELEEYNPKTRTCHVMSFEDLSDLADYVNERMEEQRCHAHNP